MTTRYSAFKDRAKPYTACWEPLDALVDKWIVVLLLVPLGLLLAFPGGRRNLREPGGGVKYLFFRLRLFFYTPGGMVAATQTPGPLPREPMDDRRDASQGVVPFSPI